MHIFLLQIFRYRCILISKRSRTDRNTRKVFTMKDIKEITEKLEQGVKDVFNSAEYMEYLSFMAKFHKYSFNNSLLIWMQKPDASHVAGYQAWKKNFKRNVKKGEKGITILAPIPRKFKKEVVNENGETEEVEIDYTAFRAVTVFDISQTEGEAVPSHPCHELEGEVENFDSLLEALKKIAPVPVGFEAIEGGANGYFHTVDKRIAVREGMSQAQTIKTLVHEISHAILHDREAGEEKEADRHTKEVQAESVAYTVCSFLGLDTSDYSFGYVAGWSQGREVKELEKSMEVIRKTASQIIDTLEAAA